MFRWRPDSPMVRMNAVRSDRCQDHLLANESHHVTVGIKAGEG